MRKWTASLFVVLCLSCSSLYGLGISGVIKGGYFYPDDKELRELYTGGFFIEREVSYAITSNILTWGSMGFFRKTGELHETKESSRLMLIPVGLGVKLRFSIPFLPIFRFYAGGGGQYLYASHKTKSDIVKKNVHNHGGGWVAKTGVQLVVGHGFILEAFGNYMYSRMTIRDIKDGEEDKSKTNIGGWIVGIGAGCEF